MREVIKAFESEENEKRIIKYYSTKAANPDETKKFVDSGLGQKRGGYKAVFDAFDGKPAADDDKAFYGLINKYIKDREEKRNTELTQKLRFLEKVEGPELLCKEEKIPNQKWHFLVSWYAYKKLTMESSGNRVLCDDKKTETTVTPDYNYFCCKELIIWLAEVIVEDKQEFEDTFNEILVLTDAKEYNDAQNNISWNETIAKNFLDKIFNAVLEITKDGVN